MVVLYWEYDSIASVYKGFSFNEIAQMAVRKRDYWSRMARWRIKQS